MKQIPPTKNEYHVCPGEDVTLVFTPMAGADPNMITISLADVPGQDGHALEADPSVPDTPTFRFTVSQPVGGSISVQYQCDFSGAVTENTRFELALSGSQGGEDLEGPTVFGEDQTRQIGLAFDVRSDCQ
jgi:hypothetical protein